MRQHAYFAIKIFQKIWKYTPWICKTNGTRVKEDMATIVV
jgi:hypothetical protein